jgi:hypothetical protein
LKRKPQNQKSELSLTEAEFWKKFGLEQYQLAKSWELEYLTLKCKHDDIQANYQTLDQNLGQLKYKFVQLKQQWKKSRRNEESWKGAANAAEKELRVMETQFRQEMESEIGSKVEEIETIKAQNVELTTQIYRMAGREDNATHDQIRTLMTDWYNESNEFCPLFFTFLDDDDITQWQNACTKNEWSMVKDFDSDIIYSFAQSQVLGISRLAAYRYALAGVTDIDIVGHLVLKGFRSFDEAIREIKTCKPAQSK